MQIKTILGVTAVAAQAMLGNACSSAPPGIKNANTVTVNFYSDAEALVQTINMGVLNTCHLLNGGSHSFNMAVGQNLFGQGIHLNTFSSSDCSGGHQSWPLTNSGTCFVGNAGSQNDWHSVRISKS